MKIHGNVHKKLYYYYKFYCLFSYFTTDFCVSVPSKTNTKISALLNQPLKIFNRLYTNIITT